MQDLLVRLFLNFRSSLDGALLAVVAWLMAQGVTLSEANTTKLVGIGALVAGALWKLFSKDPVPQPEPPSGGSTLGSHRLILIPIFLVIGLSASAWRCSNPEAAERTIVAGTYDAQLAIEAGGRTSLAFNTRGRLALSKHKTAITKLRGLSTTFQEFGKELEQWPTLDATNKPLAIDAAQRLLSKVEIIASDGDLVALDEETKSQIRRAVFVASSIANGIKVAIASAPVGTPTLKVLIPEETARAVNTARQKGFTDADALLTQDIITIWADFLVKIKMQRGQPIGTLREWRLKAFEANQAFFAAQLAR